ncbi:MAG: virulence RhuM family protein [Bacilli bacterium]|nr:virulence RhuM family protein [Bacilli bacterium]
MNKTNNYDIVKFIDKEFELEVNVSPEEETVWLSLDEMSALFERDRSVIGKHIRKIYQEKELDENRTRAKNARHLEDGRIFQVDVYNLDVIIAVGYRVNSKRGTLFRQWANKILKEYLLKGYVINEKRSLITNDNYARLINKVDSLDDRITCLEKDYKTQKVELNKIFYNGEFYDSYTLIQSIFESANNEIIIIDNYIDRTVIDRLVVKKENVRVIIYTNQQTNKIRESDLIMFNKQYGLLEIINTNKVHDRYIIIDKDKLYHLGHSIKDIGKKISTLCILDSSLINYLLFSI